MAMHDDGHGPALFAGGSFTSVMDTGDSYLGRWGGCTGCPAPDSYCTAGTTTNGCAATSSPTGTPSASSPSGFSVHCANVEGQSNGVLCYDRSGRLALPWSPGSSSYRCVSPPVQRLAVMGSGGTGGACDGAYSVDVLVYRAAHPTALGLPLSPGDDVWSQVWLRDPAAPSSTNLSDGLHWSMCP